LEFIDNIFISQGKDCNYHIFPYGAGNIFFSKESNRDIIVHRLPCKDGKMILSHKRIIEKYSSKLKLAKKVFLIGSKNNGLKE
jgi:hypothetical protein